MEVGGRKKLRNIRLHVISGMEILILSGPFWVIMGLMALNLQFLQKLVSIFCSSTLICIQNNSVGSLIWMVFLLMCYRYGGGNVDGKSF